MTRNGISNKYDNEVRFISYTGKAPALCNGVLTMNIGGKFYTFNGAKKSSYPRFWYSGGGVDNGVYTDVWRIVESLLPKDIQKYADSIRVIFNNYVEPGCCGGCRKDDIC